MSWQTVTFSAPESIIVLDNDVDAVIGNIASDCTSASARLTSAVKPEFSKNTLSIAAASIDNTVFDLTQKNIAITYAHPWLNGLYQEGPIRGFLSARNAVKACANKLADFYDNNMISGNIEALALVFSAVNYYQLSELLESFNSVFYLPELAMLQRRCLQVDNHETTKMQVPSSHAYPLLMRRSTQQLDIVNTVADLLTEKISLVEAYADQNISPAQELQNLITEKSAHVAAMQSAVADFTATFSSGAGSALFLPAGSPYNKPPLLIQAANALPEKPLAVAVVMLGAEGSLTLIKAMVGL